MSAIFDGVVEVISIGRITDISTGEFIYQVQFGRMFKVDEKNKASIPQMVGIPMSTTQVSIVLVLNVDFKGAAPYLVGSKWTINIDEKGNLSLKEVKK